MTQADITAGQERAGTWRNLVSRYDVHVEWIAQQAQVSTPMLEKWLAGESAPKREYVVKVNKAFELARETQPLRLAGGMLASFAKLKREDQLRLLEYITSAVSPETGQ